MVSDSGNKRKDSPKSIEKEWRLLSAHMGISWGEIDDQPWLVKAGKAFRQDLGQCLQKKKKFFLVTGPFV